MRARSHLPSLLLLAVATLSSPAWGTSEPVGLHQALDKLTREGKFSGAVVVHGADGVHFSRGYGWADPFENRAFTPHTPADSASLAKPITAAAVLLLVHEGKLELDAPVQRYLPEYPHSAATIRHLLSHSAGLDLNESPAGLANKSNLELLSGAATLLHRPGSAFTYCNLCSITLALLIERVAGMHYLEFVRARLAVPPGVNLRPQRLADWSGRATGYRRKADGEFERFDSWEGELLYGAANFSISAAQLAQWGNEWSQSRLQILDAATSPAWIDRNRSGLTLGNWYCGPTGRQCHYIGHHEGFHHMLYWDADRRISIALLSNNALAPALQQRLQRALVAFYESEPDRANRELATLLADVEAPPGQFQLASGEIVEVVADGEQRSVRRGGVNYPAYPVGSGIRYVPGLDLYLVGTPEGGLHWLTLYEDLHGVATSNGH